MNFRLTPQSLFENCTKAIVGDDLDVAFAKGEWAGDQGYRRSDNPYKKDTSHYQWWDSGWSKSYDELCGR
jgi:ribosome modulation factor